MFTGIITDVGTVTKVERGTGGEWGDTRMEIATRYDTSTIKVGASISHGGACMTVIETWPNGYAFEVSDESLDKTTMSEWSKGTKVNLERAMTAADELGGHLVTGHVDGMGELVGREAVAGSVKLTFSVPEVVRTGLAPKGSITVDGVSLTVNEVADDPQGSSGFSVNVIPHTAEHTTLGDLRLGDRVNLEIDLIARYVARTLANMGYGRP